MRLDVVAPCVKIATTDYQWRSGSNGQVYKKIRLPNIMYSPFAAAAKGFLIENCPASGALQILQYPLVIAYYAGN